MFAKRAIPVQMYACKCFTFALVAQVKRDFEANITFTSSLDTFITRANMYVYIYFTVIANLVQM